MGYEVKMIVGTTPMEPMAHERGRQWISEIAVIDLRKIGAGSFYDLVSKTKTEKVHPCYIFASNGNTRIIKDRYGDPLCKVPAEEALKALQKDESEEPYRRYRTAIVLLESVIKEFPNENPIVVFYGH